ncbi:2OG-Fe(II) oxygenase [Granulosicoccaceae sp. 1_MG-2023]|nr:2OG-Fe(II) oxygenase [Granulosicoccaceae sp. 1_MG-2023]
MLATDLSAGAFPTESHLDALSAALRLRGYAVLDNMLPPALVDALLADARGGQADFRPAATGRRARRRSNPFVRRDAIAWLEPQASAAQAAYLALMAALRSGLNRRLLLGLFSYEAQFSHYPDGAFYRKHYDAFRGERNRVLSTVLYLNPAWQSDDAGQLRVFDPADDTLELCCLLPHYGRLVVFLSEEFAHEVLPTRRSRYSIAGWFRLNSGALAAVPLSVPL